MKKAEEHFNKTISWYQKRGLLPNDWFEVGQPAFKRALKIAQQEKVEDIFEELIEHFEKVIDKNAFNMWQIRKTTIKRELNKFKVKHRGGERL